MGSGCSSYGLRSNTVDVYHIGKASGQIKNANTGRSPKATECKEVSEIPDAATAYLPSCDADEDAQNKNTSSNAPVKNIVTDQNVPKAQRFFLAEGEDYATSEMVPHAAVRTYSDVQSAFAALHGVSESLSDKDDDDDI